MLRWVISLSKSLDADTEALNSSKAAKVDSVGDNLLAIDLKAFEQTRELLGDSFPDIVDSILSDVDNALEKLSNWTNPLDIDGFALLPHSMKSCSAYIGATKLNQLAAECETDARAGNIEKASSYLNEMKLTYKDVIKDLATLGYNKTP